MSRLPAWQSPKSSIPVARRGLCGKLTGSRAREQMIGSMTALGLGRVKTQRRANCREIPDLNARSCEVRFALMNRRRQLAPLRLKSAKT